ncbi:MAG: hypothetical protein OXG08_12190 [Gammaproteobacteria bacterium]|nr:hypothetical protein [Gammaproteobacteria bacterium]
MLVPINDYKEKYVRKAGGIVAIIGGAIGLFVAFGMVFIGSVGASVAENADLTELEEAITVTDEETGDEIDLDLAAGLETMGKSAERAGWFGLIFSVVALGLGIWAIMAKNWMPGAGIIVASVLGVVLGSLAMILPMVITGIGGILALFPISEAAASED